METYKYTGVYKLTAYSSEHGFLITWHANAREALSAQKHATKYGMTCDIKYVEVPHKRDELVTWLNSNLTSDNG